MSIRPIYLDFQSTTPVDPQVLSVMLPYFTEVFGNAAGDHPYAVEAADAVETARRQVAALIGALPREVIFTSGATEANNLLIAGTARAARARGRDRVVTLATEHKSVLEITAALAREGFQIDIAPVEPDGHVDLARLSGLIDDRTAVVSAMAANNEIGVLHPIEQIGALCRRAGAAFHCDAAQATGKIPLDVVAQSVDLMSVSAHKLYGPKGVGAAFISRASPVRPQAIAWGGGQEYGLRPGTLPTALCAGLGAACEIAGQRLGEDSDHVRALRDRFLVHLGAAGLSFDVNGDMARRLPGNLNVSFSDVDAEALLMTVRSKVAAASGSACTAHALEPSHVVLALGFGEVRAEGAVRFGFGRPTTASEVDAAAAVVVDSVRHLQRVSYAPGAAIQA